MSARSMRWSGASFVRTTSPHHSLGHTRRPPSWAYRHVLRPVSDPSVALCSSRRCIVQSSGHGGIRSILDQYTDHVLAQQLRRNARGNYYRHQQKLWPSSEALEKEWSVLEYGAVERMPLAFLPTRQAPARVFACEGAGGIALLERAQAEETPADASITDVILRPEAVEGSVLASARDRARQRIEEDLSVNTPLERALRRPATACDAAGAVWTTVGLDPLLSGVAEARYGASPTRLQSRLLPALLHEDHHDVLFNGVTGSGKTTALLLAMLQGVRGESAGMNILVASHTLNAMRLHDALHALCRAGGGGRVVDRPETDLSWLLMGTYREHHRRYYAQLRRSLTSPNGPVRLFITTADVLCELLFEDKMEFAAFGYLRRVYVDDVGPQLPLLPADAPVAAARERLRNPLALELLLGTLHQLPGPHIRSILQLGLVSADVDGRLKAHLLALCLKPAAHTVVLAPVRLPSTIRCFFSLHLPTENLWAYTARLLWNARASIPGRAILFVDKDVDMLETRRRLRGYGVEAKLLSEVYTDGAFQEAWKFLLLKESEGFAVDIPLVSHVFITFVPRSWQSYQHMCGRVGRLGNLGWAFIVTDRRHAQATRRLVQDLDVAFCTHVVDEHLAPMEASEADRLTREPTLYGLDPQYAVQQHYEQHAEHPDLAYRPREFFSRPVVKQFQMEDYTPTPVAQRRFTNAKMLARDVERDPSTVVKMQQMGFLDHQLRPTTSLRRAMNVKSRKGGSSPFHQPRP